MCKIMDRAKHVVTTEINGLQMLLENLDKEFVEASRIISNCRGKVVVTGVGKSGLIGRKISATLSSLGIASFFMNPLDALHGDLGSVQFDDVMIALSHSGKSLEINEIVKKVIEKNVRVIALTGNRFSQLARMANITLNSSIPQEACMLGLAPTSSTTAALVLGDALAVCCSEIRGMTSTAFLNNHPQGALADRITSGEVQSMVCMR